MLAELNEKHLSMMEEKQRRIQGLESKLENLSQYRSGDYTRYIELRKCSQGCLHQGREK